MGHPKRKNESSGFLEGSRNPVQYRAKERTSGGGNQLVPYSILCLVALDCNLHNPLLSIGFFNAWLDVYQISEIKKSKYYRNVPLLNITFSGRQKISPGDLEVVFS